VSLSRQAALQRSTRRSQRGWKTKTSTEQEGEEEEEVLLLLVVLMVHVAASTATAAGTDAAGMVHLTPGRCSSSLALAPCQSKVCPALQSPQGRPPQPQQRPQARPQPKSGSRSRSSRSSSSRLTQ
jgi:hypothetical protein